MNIRGINEISGGTRVYIYSEVLVSVRIPPMPPNPVQNWDPSCERSVIISSLHPGP